MILTVMHGDRCCSKIYIPTIAGRRNMRQPAVPKLHLTPCSGSSHMLTTQKGAVVFQNPQQWCTVTVAAVESTVRHAGRG